MTIIVDTNFLFALKAEKDKNRARAIEIFEEINKPNELLISNFLVVSELFTLAVSRSYGNSYFLNQINELIWGEECFFKIYAITSHEFQKIYKILIKYCSPKKIISYVDASLIFLYEKFKADYILSFDSHFDNIVKRKY